MKAPQDLPPADPACPKAAPVAGSACTTAAGTALSCAWDLGDAIERCACVAQEGLPTDAKLTWNCDEGVSGEGPAINLCPEQLPETGTQCSAAGLNCRYGVPRYAGCDCVRDKLQWKCDGDSGARGGP
jgi:hypothetical protein